MKFALISGNCCSRERATMPAITKPRRDVFCHRNVCNTMSEKGEYSKFYFSDNWDISNICTDIYDRWSFPKSYFTIFGHWCTDTYGYWSISKPLTDMDGWTFSECTGIYNNRNVPKSNFTIFGHWCTEIYN